MISDQTCELHEKNGVLLSRGALAFGNCWLPPDLRHLPFANRIIFALPRPLLKKKPLPGRQRFWVKH